MGWVGNYGRTANGDEMWVGAARWNEIIIEDAVFSLEQYHGVDYITKNDVDYYLIHPMKELLPDDRYTVKGDDGFSVRVRRDSNYLEFENLSPEPTEEELEAGYKDLGTVSLGTSEVDFDITFGLMHTIEKAAEIYNLVMSSSGGRVLQTITDENLLAIAKEFGVELNRDFIG
jgi:hypothetical protein